MKRRSTIEFILNEELVEIRDSPGMVLLDFIRKQAHLMGTKIGCREGDCGACTVLVGELRDGHVTYHTETSCLMPLGNADGCHIVTVEGINGDELTPIQRAICDHGAAQCGFCTVGFVMSLTDFCLSHRAPTKDNIIRAMDGNICRCTGYLALRRAAFDVLTILKQEPKERGMPWLIGNGFVPPYFAHIPNRLAELWRADRHQIEPEAKWVGGGTDLYVQKPDEMTGDALNFARHIEELRGIRDGDSEIWIGGATTTEELHASNTMHEAVPILDDAMRLISSTPIRSMATVAGNLVNASPIGDLTILFLALDAQLILQQGTSRRTCPLRDFYRGYKDIDLRPGEIIRELVFRKPDPTTHLGFEKVCKRTYLDIASVNSAAKISVVDGQIVEARFSAGGVAPIPLFLSRASGAVEGRPLDAETIRLATETALQEIAPISDVRGSAQYKKLLLRQLILAHFLTAFPEVAQLKELI